MFDTIIIIPLVQPRHWIRSLVPRGSIPCMACCQWPDEFVAETSSESSRRLQRGCICGHHQFRATQNLQYRLCTLCSNSSAQVLGVRAERGCDQSPNLLLHPFARPPPTQQIVRRHKIRQRQIISKQANAQEKGMDWSIVFSFINCNIVVRTQQFTSERVLEQVKWQLDVKDGS